MIEWQQYSEKRRLHRYHQTFAAVILRVEDFEVVRAQRLHGVVPVHRLVCIQTRGNGLQAPKTQEGGESQDGEQDEELSAGHGKSIRYCSSDSNRQMITVIFPL